jgi:hypothetical protein
MWTEVGGTAVVCVACAPSNIFVLDQDCELPGDAVGDEWRSLLERIRASKASLVLKSCTRGAPHYVFRQGKEWVAEGVWIGGEVKSSGMIVISTHEPIVDVGLATAPKALLDKLKLGRTRGGYWLGACSKEEMWDWLTTTPDAEDLMLDLASGEKFLDALLRGMDDKIDGGAHRRMACLDSVFQAAIEAAAGCYPAEHAYAALKEAYRNHRESRGDLGEKGWTRSREVDYDLMWQSLIPAIKAGKHDEKIAEKRVSVADRYPADDREWTEEDIEEFLAALRGAESVDAVVAGIASHESAPRPSGGSVAGRSGPRLTITRASEIEMRPVHWTWENRIPVGSLSLLGGREGIGKSTLAYQITSDITTGRLPGEFLGSPRSVVVVATEDSWSHTIVPRLAAAGADLSRVLRVDINEGDGSVGSVSLPRDILALKALIRAEGVAMVLLDPLMSRLDAKLDSHKDADVRLALEPLVRMADETAVAVLGLIHVNKSGSSDPLTLLMASRAFAAVSRAVLFVMLDPQDKETRLLGQPENNLGRTDLPTLTFEIEGGVKVADTAEGEVLSSRIVWTGESEKDIDEALISKPPGPATDDAMAWLRDYLDPAAPRGHVAAWRRDVVAAAGRDGITTATLDRARKKRTDIRSERFGFPAVAYWTRLPEGSPPLEEWLAASSRKGET